MFTVAEAKRLTGGGLGYPSKMPGTSYGISAHKCKVGGKLQQVEGSTCHSCYALKGHYIYSSVAKAHERRLASFAGAAWSQAMAFLIARTGTKWHRWFDSGDLQSVDMLTKICTVAALTPKVRHWLPTRELACVLAYVTRGGVVPDNLVIRVSDTMMDGKPTGAWPLTSAVHKHAPAQGRACPAPQQNNMCGKCRSCWSKDIPRISYHAH